MIRGIRDHKASNAMQHTLNDNAKLTANLVAASEAALYNKAHDTTINYGYMSLGHAYEIMQVLTHGAPCQTIGMYPKPVSRLAIVKVLRLCFELGYKLGKEANERR